MLADTAPNVSPAEAGKRIAAIKSAAAEAAKKVAPKETPEAEVAPKKKKVAPAIKTTTKPEAPEAEAEQDLDLGNSDEGQPAAEGEEGGERADPADEAEDQPEEGQDPDGQEEEQDDEGAEDDMEALHTVVVDGKEEQVPLKELLQGYSRTRDYTRKTEALAKQRKEVERVQETLKDLPQQREKYVNDGARFAKNAALVLAALQTRFMPQAPTAELLESNPKAYILAKERYAEALQFMGSLKTEMTQIEGQHKAAHQKALGEGREKLLQIRPELKDPATKGKLVNYALSLGFSQDALANEPNPVLFDIAYKAMMYDDLMARKKLVKANGTRPKVIKHSKAEESRAAKEQNDRAETMKQHEASGTVNSGAAAINKLLSGRKKA